MCQVAVTQGGYRLALVTYAGRDEAKSIVTKAHAGHNDGFLESLNATWSDGERGRGTIGAAIRSGRTEVIRSIARDPRAAPWREAMLARGYASALSMPLRVENAVIGTLTFIAPEEDAFDEAEQALLEEMAADLSFGIETLRRDARRVAAEEAAKSAALRDALTGLPNRARFLQLLGAGLAAPGNEPLAVLVVHLPGLQRIYDALGHDALNQIFVEIARRLVGGPAGGRALARVQDNDFALFAARTHADAAGGLGDALMRAFEAPIVVNGAPIEVRACIGAAFCPGHGAEADILLRRAAIASRQAARKDFAFAVYQGAKERENPASLALVAELRTAIEERTLELHYQPKIDLTAGRACGAEALIRWPHAAKGMISPAQFVPLAEQTGLIRSMTYFVVEAAVRRQRAWRDAGLVVPVAINLSARNLYDPKLLERIEAIVGTWGIDPKALEIEITEGALVEDTQAARTVLARLSALCGKIYIDDFGTGYSSLSYLVSLPVHALKIDRAFVIQMSKSRQARAVVESVISMAHALGLRVVAEGVETAEDAQLLRELGCDEAQGYFFGRPVPPADFGRFLT
jgi:diguanylate cyclase (GGDEF)-like protein